jgi:hypothetical protein
MTSSASRYTIRLVDPSDTGALAAIVPRWDELARTSSHPFAFRQSPEWWHYTLPEFKDVRAAIGVVEAPDCAILGVVPVRCQNYALDYSIRSWQIAKMPLRVISVLGSEPLVPSDESVFFDLISSLLAAFEDCDGVYLEWVATGSDCWNITSLSRSLRRHVFAFHPMRPHKCHFVTVPDSYDQYLARFKPRTRQHLRRQVRRLRDHGGGRFECLRIEREADVPVFLEAASQLVVGSRVYRNTGWKVVQNTPEMQERLTQLAHRGVLRSYLLRCGDEFCAFSLGFQYGQTLYSSFIGFDDRLAKFSPGTTLHFMTIEDLCSYRPPKRMNLDAGTWPYLRELETDSLEGNAVLLLRRTARNCLRAAAHGSFLFSAETARRLIRWARSLKSPGTAALDSAPKP